MLMQKLKIGVAGLLTITALGFSTVATAQYTGPNTQQKVVSVAELLKAPQDDQQVVLRGKILRKLSHEKYIFSDGTGEIRVEIDDKKFPQQAINETTKVEIRGELEKDFMESPEIDVDAVILL